MEARVLPAKKGKKGVLLDFNLIFYEILSYLCKFQMWKKKIITFIPTIIIFILTTTIFYTAYLTQTQ